jgi:hypothetical protein
VTGVVNPDLADLAPGKLADERQNLAPALFVFLVTDCQCHDVVELDKIDPAKLFNE